MAANDVPLYKKPKEESKFLVAKQRGVGCG